MGVQKATAEGVVVTGDLDEGAFMDFEAALNAIRSGKAAVPVIDLQGVPNINSKGIGALVALWVELMDTGRYFDLVASDKVWMTLEKAGVARVFFQRPK
jgi:anti-anti-sigma regulatory factor